MKKIMIILLAAVVAAVGLTACGDGIRPVSLSVTENHREIRDEGGLLLVDTVLDSIDCSGGGEDAAGRINAFFYQNYIRPADNTIYEMSEYMTQPSGESDPGMSCYYARNVSAGRSDESVFVLKVHERQYYSGQVNETQLRTAICFDPVTGTQLELSDLGADGSDPSDRIARLFARELMSGEYSHGLLTEEEAVRAIGVMIRRDVWYLDQSGLVLICNEQALSEESELLELRLDKEQLAGVVDERWFEQ